VDHDHHALDQLTRDLEGTAPLEGDLGVQAVGLDPEAPRAHVVDRDAPGRSRSSVGRVSLNCGILPLPCPAEFPPASDRSPDSARGRSSPDTTDLKDAKALLEEL